MFSAPHLIIIFLVALIVFGPEKLPELARNFGKVMAEFRRATGDLKSTFEEHLRDLEREADEHRLRTGHPQATAPFTVTGGAMASAPDHVVAATPLSARIPPQIPAASAPDGDFLSDDAGSNEPSPSISEMKRSQFTNSATESLPDPAASLATAPASSASQPLETESKSEIVSDGHRSS